MTATETITVILEQFDPNKFRLEKVGFRLSDKCFNVCGGWGDDDDLRYSRLYRGQWTTEQVRQQLWQEIKQYLPRYKAGELKLYGEEPRWYRGKWFKAIMFLVEAAKEHGYVKLIYASDRPHAEMIKRCVEWLLTQV
ncbi:hypothetical protein [Nostoc sp. NMS8]|uniref:hypothetical protein n=1 Tax=Nostoc sp. NMS8 TaxID=2815392 RepID=UPI0025FA5D0A|nr:hypothetical protein [Nostoc sp. NMS8]MBN3961754.1 hypothetical protein [Nostoc sp. NMS8]